MGSCQSQDPQQEINIERDQSSSKLRQNNKLENLNSDLLNNSQTNNNSQNINNSQTNSASKHPDQNQHQQQQQYNFHTSELKIQQQKEQLIQKHTQELQELNQQKYFKNLPEKDQQHQLHLLQQQHDLEMQGFLQEQQLQLDQATLPGQQSQMQASYANSQKSQQQQQQQQDSQFQQQQQNEIQQHNVMYQEIQQRFEYQELETFFLVTTIFNPAQSKKKQEVYKKFKKYCQLNNIPLITIEYCDQSCPFMVTQSNFEPINFQIRVEEALSLKYNLVNTIIDQLPQNWSWIAVVDYNIIFNNFDWIEQCKYNLQTTCAQQLFNYSSPLPYQQYQQQFLANQQSNNTSNIQNNNLNNLNNNNMSESQSDNISQQINSFQKFASKECLSKHMQAIEVTPDNLSTIVSTFEIGKAWAFRRDFVEVFGLQDFFVAGQEELFFMLCLVQKCSQSVSQFFNENVINFIQGYEQDFQLHEVHYGYIENEISYVPITNQNYILEESLQVMQSLQDNLQKNDDGIFVTGSYDLSDSKLQELRDSLL